MNILLKLRSVKNIETKSQRPEAEIAALAILDVMLPGTSGFAICQKIRERHNYPVVMLTAKIEETDKITGLTLGADDYITKPFRPLELTPTEFSILRILLENKCQAVSAEELFHQIWRDVVLHQVQQHHHRAHLAPAREAGGGR